MPDGNRLNPVSYQLLIRLCLDVRIRIGRLGEFDFPAGFYIYTGSGRRNIEARIARHRRRRKPLHWHIDHLLAHPAAEILDVRLSVLPECRLNQATAGEMPAPGFGASDCHDGCHSHLRFIRCTGTLAGQRNQ
jgi:Uncharacterized conserved protein